MLLLCNQYIIRNIIQTIKIITQPIRKIMQTIRTITQKSKINILDVDYASIIQTKIIEVVGNTSFKYYVYYYMHVAYALRIIRYVAEHYPLRSILLNMRTRGK